MATLTELVIAMGFDVKSESFQTFSKFVGGLDAIKEGFEKVGKLATGGKSLKDFIIGTASSGAELLILSDRLGMSTAAIQKWQYAAERAGASASSVMSDIESLQLKGIHTQKALLNLSKRVQNANPFGLQILKQIYGISDDTITLFRRGPEAIKKYMDELERMGGVDSKEALETSRKLTESIVQTKTALQSAAETVASTYMPRILEMSQAFNNWIQDTEHQDTLLKALTITLGGLAASSLVSGIITLAVNLKKLAGTLLLLKTASLALLTGPVGVALAGIGALGAGIGALGAGALALFEHGEQKKRQADPFGYKGVDENTLKGKIYKMLGWRTYDSQSIEPTKYVPTRERPFVPPMPENQGATTNVGDINITIMTDQAGQALAESIKQYAGIDITTGALSYKSVS